MAIASTVCTAAFRANAQAALPPGSPATDSTGLAATADSVPRSETNQPGFGPNGQIWNWHVQNTDIVQGDPAFPAKYSGPASLNSQGEIQETVTMDLFAGLRLWHGAEMHVDGLMWQGFGLSQTHGIEAFPNGDALTYGPEKVLETYYDFKIWKTIHAALDYQFVADPAFNQDRGPVSICGARLHWEF